MKQKKNHYFEARENPAEALLPREKLLARNASYLSDQELLAAILGSGQKGAPVAELARRVMTFLDKQTEEVSIHQLIELKGIGPAKGALLSAALEFGRRRFKPAFRQITTPEDVLPLVQHYVDRPQEMFFAISLNGAHEVQQVHRISLGLLNRTVVHPREVFAEMIQDRAAATIVAHNHPSGNLTPSDEDQNITQRLKQAGDILGIPVLDHLIFSIQGYYSFLEHNRI